MKKLLVVVDMQNDFITGSLGTKEAQAIVKPIAKLVNNFEGDIVFTQDTHYENYLSTQEGKHLPVPHCIKNTEGWRIVSEIDTVSYLKSKYTKFIYEKETFGSVELANLIYRMKEDWNEIILCGVCTGICVLSNAILIKSLCPETKITILKDLCACVTPESHKNAIEIMKLLQIDVK